MLTIINPKLNLSTNFSGIKVIQSSSEDNLVRYFLDEQTIINLHNKRISSSDIIYINETTRTSDILIWNKQSKFYKDIVDLLFEYPIVNENNKNKITLTLNEKYNYEFLSTTSGDISKIITTSFEINNDQFLNWEILEHLLDSEIYEEKKLFIFNGFSDVNVELLKPYLEKHYFLILTSDFRRVIKDINDLEALSIYKQKEIFDILDIDTITNYLELKLSTKITFSSYRTLVNQLDSFESLRLLYEVNNIEF